MGTIGEIYRNDSLLGDLFILECYDQCQVEFMKSFLGEELVTMIYEYKKIVPYEIRYGYL